MESLVGAMRFLTHIPALRARSSKNGVKHRSAARGRVIVGLLNDLAQRLGARAEQALRSMIQDPAPKARFVAGKPPKLWVGFISEATTSDALIRLLQDDSIEVVITAIKSAGIQRREFVPPLVALLVRKGRKARPRPP